MAQFDRVGRGYDAVVSFSLLKALEGLEEFLQQVVDVDEGHSCISVIDDDWEVSCDVVAEGRYCAVVVGFGPFAEEIG